MIRVLVVWLFTALTGASIAWATPPLPGSEPATFPSWWKDAWGLHVDGDAYLIKAGTLSQPLADWHFKLGYALPIRSGERDPQPVGFVFIGEGRHEVRFAEKRDAVATANGLVLQAEWSREEAQPVADGGPLVLHFEEAIFFTVDPAAAELIAQATPVETDGRVLFHRDEPTTVISSDLVPLGQARRRAAELLRDETRFLHQIGLDPRATLRLERLRTERFGKPAATWFVWTHTDHVLRPLLGYDPDKVGTGRWLAYVRDDTGRFDSRLRSQVAVVGRSEERFKASLDPENNDDDTTDLEAPLSSFEEGELIGPVSTRLTLSGEPFPAAFRSVPLPEVRLDPTRGAVRVIVDLVDTGATVKVDVEAAIEVVAVGDTAHTVTLMMPRSEGRAWMTERALPDHWRIRSIALEDGSRLDWYPTEAWERRGAPPRWAGYEEILVVLPEPLAVSESLLLQIDFEDEVRYSHVIQGSLDLGSGTGLLPVLPLISEHPGASYPVAMAMGVPSGRRQGLALSGVETREWEDKTHQWRQTEATSQVARVAMGRWTSAFYAKPAFGFPGVRSQFLPGQGKAAEDLPIRVRQVISFYRTILPEFPQDELQVVELPGAWGERESGWSNGFVTLRAMRDPSAYAPTLDAALPEFGFAGVARAVAEHYWLGTERHPRDAAVAEAVSHSYAALFLRTGFGERPYKQWVKAWSDCVAEQDPVVRLSLVDSWSTIGDKPARACAGPMVLGHMLRRRVGDQAFLGGVDDVLRGRLPATIEGLQQAIETRSEQDLSEFFDFWAHGGWIPEVRVEWAVQDAEDPRDTRAIGKVTADVPFGTFSVPLEITRSPREKLFLWVTVTDGEGHFDERTAFGRAKRVTVNPERRILLRKGKAKKVDLERLAPAP